MDKYPDITIRRSTAADLPRLDDIFAAARRYMAASGNPSQWGATSPRRELVLADLDRGESYVIEFQGRVVATFALVADPDPHYAVITDGPGWEDSPQPYMTLHRVASDGTVGGLMPRIFDWAATHSDHLRIDTHADNATMLGRIARAGFRFCGIVLMDDGTPRRAFQRIVTSPVTAADVLESLEMQRSDCKREVLMRFFKTGKGQYGEGDEFLGLTVPQTRAVVREYRGRVSLPEIERLLHSPWHEARLAGLLLLVAEMDAAMPRRGLDTPALLWRRNLIADFYLRHAHCANNWDLVDMSAPGVLGRRLLVPVPGGSLTTGSLPDTSVLDCLAADANLWRQRIAIVSTLALIRAGRYEDTLRISDRLLSHPHDLIHKAVGWMLREVGKRDRDVLTDYLDANHASMSRTTLRYAIERLPEPLRMHYLHLR